MHLSSLSERVRTYLEEPLMILRKKIAVAVTVLAATSGIAFGGGAFAASPESVTATRAAAVPSVPSDYTAVDPVRLLDTRATTALGPGAHTVLTIAGTNGVPATGVTAVALNVTATDATAASFLSVYPDGTTRPNTSNLNFSARQTIANQVTVALGADGAVDIYNSAGHTQVLVDLLGYYTADSTLIRATTVPTEVNGAVTLTQIGGTIRTGVTKLTNAVTLQPGSYQVTASGVFGRDAHTGVQGATGVPNTYGTLVIWEDLNNDGLYDWSATPSENAGTAQTGAIPRMAIDTTSTIEASADLTSVITVTQPDTTVYLGGFGYNDDTSGYGTTPGPGAGDFSVVPSMTIQKLNVG
jgi:hypothetical protein